MSDSQNDRDARLAEKLDAARAYPRDRPRLDTTASHADRPPTPEEDTDLFALVRDLDAAVQDWKGDTDISAPQEDELTSALPCPLPGGRYTVVAEIARGGMDAVYRALDGDLERPLAVKVMGRQLPLGGTAEERFLNEARLTGQLQHPGIPPVHDLGHLHDGRPFFSMKLIEGETLADLLGQRPTPQTDLPRFLRIFDQLAQTLAYAHGQGVIHRDLKPANIMVGPFGEVQVMDWGLAKRLPSGEPTAPDQTRQARGVSPLSPATQGAYAPRSPTGGDALTMEGTVLGTLAYMPPEQALGRVEALDERCDVFGLGAILCVILTGEPPYGRAEEYSLRRRVEQADLAEAHERLNTCGADAEVIALAKDCLSAQLDDRPRDARVVAERMGAFLALVQERLQTAERQRAADQVRAVEARKRRRILLGVGLAVLLLITVIGGMLARQRQARAEVEVLRRRAVIEALVQASTAHDQLRDQLTRRGGVFVLLNRPHEWKNQTDAILIPLMQAANLRNVSDQPLGKDIEERIEHLERLWKETDAARSLAQNLDQIRQDRATWGPGGFDNARARREYAEAFANAEIDIQEPWAGPLIKQSPIREQLVATLDDWALLTWGQDKPLLARLLELARSAAPGPWSDQLRQPHVWDDGPAIAKLGQQLSQDPKALAELSPHLLYVVGAVRRRHREDVQGWLRQAQLLHPSDFQLGLEVGLASFLSNPAESAGYFRIALGIRPDNSAAWNNLGGALHLQKRLDESVTAYRRALELSPDHVVARSNLGDVLMEQGKLGEALAAFDECLVYAPEDDRTWRRRGILLDQLAKFREAEESFRRAADLSPRSPAAWNDLGVFLDRQQKQKDAADAYRRALNLAPDFADAHRNLGLLLKREGRFDEALAELRRGQELGSRIPGWPDPQGQDVKECERLQRADQQLSAILRGEIYSKSNEERLALAELCAQIRKRYAIAVRFYREAFAHDKGLLETPGSARYNASCAAVLASAGLDRTERLDESQRGEFRQQALEWLRGELATYRSLLMSGKQEERQLARSLLDHLVSDSDLASVRAAASLEKLPTKEQGPWRSLWVEVEKLRRTPKMP